MKNLNQNTKQTTYITRTLVKIMCRNRLKMMFKHREVGPQRMEYLKNYIKKCEKAYQTQASKYPEFKKTRIEYEFSYKFSKALLKAFKHNGNKPNFTVTYKSKFKHSLLDPVEYRDILCEIAKEILEECNFSNYNEYIEFNDSKQFEDITIFTFIITK